MFSRQVLDPKIRHQLVAAQWWIGKACCRVQNLQLCLHVPVFDVPIWIAAMVMLTEKISDFPSGKVLTVENKTDGLSEIRVMTLRTRNSQPSASSSARNP